MRKRYRQGGDIRRLPLTADNTQQVQLLSAGGGGGAKGKVQEISTLADQAQTDITNSANSIDEAGAALTGTSGNLVNSGTYNNSGFYGGAFLSGGNDGFGSLSQGPMDFYNSVSRSTNMKKGGKVRGGGLARRRRRRNA